MKFDDGRGSLASLVEITQEAKRRRSERDPAFTEIVRRFQDMAFGYAFSVVGDFHAAEDIAQEAFMEAWTHLQDLREAAAFPGWFRRIVWKRCDRYIRRKRLPSASMAEAEHAPSNAPDPHALAERGELMDAVRALPEPERAATALFYVSGYTHAEIADFLETTPATVNNRLRAARRTLRIKMLGERMLENVKESLHAQRPSRTEAFLNEAVKRPPELNADKWAIFQACNDGDLDTVRRMLDENPELIHAGYAYWQPLHFASRAGRTEIVKLLLERGADPLESVWWAYNLPVDMAADRGHDEIVALLKAAMKPRANLNEDGGDNPLCDAVRAADFARIDALLDEQPELMNVAERVPDRDSETQQPLHIAVEMGSIRLVEILLNRGADIEGQRSDGYKAIHLALWKRPSHRPEEGWQMAQYLIDRGATYSISVAAARNDMKTVRAMLDEDPSRVNEQDTFGYRPISCAAERHHVEMVRFLLERGADPNLPEAASTKGYALYSVTFGNEHVEIARMLLEAGADLRSERESSGDPTYAIVAQQWQRAPKSPELVNLLYEYGASIGIGLAARVGRLDIVGEILAVDPSKAQDGLGGAIRDGRLDIARLLIRRGARYNPKTVAAWQTPMMQALGHRQVDVAAFLLEQGDDINWTNWRGQGPIHYAIKRDRPDMIDWALDHGADIDLRDWELESRPLGWAAHYGHRACVEALLRRGATVHHPEDQSWNAPIARAEKRGYTEIAELLRRHETHG